MDFVAWCDRVLQVLAEAASRSPTARLYGIDDLQLWKLLFGDETATSPTFWGSERFHAVLDALEALKRIGLIEHEDHFPKLIPAMRQFVGDLTPFWTEMCLRLLEPEQEQVLELVNRLSVKGGPDYAWLDVFNLTPHAEALSLSPELIRGIGHELNEFGLITVQYGGFANYSVAATYEGLVWQTRRGMTLESQRIDEVVEEWETTSVEFKRELYLDNDNQKAEFIKDILGLANTQSSPPRLLIIGFDNKTRSYHAPPDPRITQDRIEQILSHFTTPNVDIRYTLVEYRAGMVGQIEVLRNRKKLPYRVACDVGGKNRIVQGTVVRHGSQTEPASVAEVEAIQKEAERANISP